jgi:molecular chaperone DnaK
MSQSGDEFSQVYTPKQRSVSTKMLASEILLLEAKIQNEIDDAQINGHEDAADGLEKVLFGVQELIGSAAELAEDDVTDKGFRLEDKKENLLSKCSSLLQVSAWVL